MFLVVVGGLLFLLFGEVGWLGNQLQTGPCCVARAMLCCKGEQNAFGSFNTLLNEKVSKKMPLKRPKSMP
eukprot:1448437-Amphidinium_carterae.1